MVIAVPFQYQTSPYPCVDADGFRGCGAKSGEPCVIRPGGGRLPEGKVRATMHSHRRREMPSAPLGEEYPDLLDGVRAPLPQPQPAPVVNEHSPIVPQVIEDLNTRAVAGRLKYGTTLQPFNGRDPARDAYEEAQDMTLYLKQFVIERAAMLAELESLRAEVATLRLQYTRP